ncbi:unnamed protein product [Schistosoma margrebowiei]|uniref:Uncharacterized protein n=1 Tax=Schistosoma margrebowiei TaxID=48269 RepID=A0A183NBI1_9TREM|nr:unnamed protein product [Schistosoma margrebowiei]
MKTWTTAVKHGIQWTAQNQLDDLDFADDIAIRWHIDEQMQMKTTSVVEASVAVGLNIHKGRREILNYNTENINPITLDGETPEQVEISTYLGSIIDECGGSDSDLQLMIGEVRAAF